MVFVLLQIFALVSARTGCCFSLGGVTLAYVPTGLQILPHRNHRPCPERQADGTGRSIIWVNSECPRDAEEGALLQAGSQLDLPSTHTLGASTRKPALMPTSALPQQDEEQEENEVEEGKLPAAADDAADLAQEGDNIVFWSG